MLTPTSTSTLAPTLTLALKLPLPLTRTLPLPPTPTVTLTRYPVLMLCNLRAGTGASAHKPLDSWLVQLSMLAADGLFWLWLTLAAYAHAHPSGFTAVTPLLLEACLFAATLAAFALHYAALLHKGALHPAFAPLLLLELLVLGAVVALVGRQLLGGGDNQLLGAPPDGHAREGTPDAELLLHLQARTHSSDSTPARTSAPPRLRTSAPPRLRTSRVQQRSSPEKGPSSGCRWSGSPPSPSGPLPRALSCRGASGGARRARPLPRPI